MANDEERRQKKSRVVIGGATILLGLVFMLIPFIPLGYLLIIAGLFIISPLVPKTERLIEKAKKRDKRGRVEKAQIKADKLVAKGNNWQARRRKEANEQ